MAELDELFKKLDTHVGAGEIKAVHETEATARDVAHMFEDFARIYGADATTVEDVEKSLDALNREFIDRIQASKLRTIGHLDKTIDGKVFAPDPDSLDAPIKPVLDMNRTLSATALILHLLTADSVFSSQQARADKALFDEYSTRVREIMKRALSSRGVQTPDNAAKK